MKYLIIGLGNFGASLAEKLTQQGHEVIGVDNHMSKVEALKEKVTHTICLDASDEMAVAGLPLQSTDVVIVAIGEDQGANILVTAIFKNLQVKRLISRAINVIHEKVLHAIGVDEIVHPEEETAERWAKKLCLRGVVDSFHLDPNYAILEINVPEALVGKSIMGTNVRQDFNLLVLTIIKHREAKSTIGRTNLVANIQGVATPDQLLESGDSIVIYGANRDLQAFIKQYSR